MKIDEDKLRYELRLVRERHKRQDLEDKVDAMEWDSRKKQREADSIIAAHAADAATAKAKMKASQDEARAAAEDAKKANAERNEAIAAADAATAKAAQAECDAKAAATDAAHAPAWELVKPCRFQGYGRPVYEVLKAAQAAHLPRPKARDVLEAFRSKKPPEIHMVLSDSLDYYDAAGSVKAATLDNIRKVIGRLVR